MKLRLNKILIFILTSIIIGCSIASGFFIDKYSFDANCRMLDTQQKKYDSYYTHVNINFENEDKLSNKELFYLNKKCSYIGYNRKYRYESFYCTADINGNIDKYVCNNLLFGETLYSFEINKSIAGLYTNTSSTYFECSGLKLFLTKSSWSPKYDSLCGSYIPASMAMKIIEASNGALAKFEDLLENKVSYDVITNGLVYKTSINNIYFDVIPSKTSARLFENMSDSQFANYFSYDRNLYNKYYETFTRFTGGSIFLYSTNFFTLNRTKLFADIGKKYGNIQQFFNEGITKIEETCKVESLKLTLVGDDLVNFDSTNLLKTFKQNSISPLFSLFIVITILSLALFLYLFFDTYKTIPFKNVNIFYSILLSIFAILEIILHIAFKINESTGLYLVLNPTLSVVFIISIIIYFIYFIIRIISIKHRKKEKKDEKFDYYVI